jgi:hypothetical protein
VAAVVATAVAVVVEAVIAAVEAEGAVATRLVGAAGAAEERESVGVAEVARETSDRRWAAERTSQMSHVPVGVAEAVDLAVDLKTDRRSDQQTVQAAATACRALEAAVGPPSREEAELGRVAAAQVDPTINPANALALAVEVKRTSSGFDLTNRTEGDPAAATTGRLVRDKAEVVSNGARVTTTVHRALDKAEAASNGDPVATAVRVAGVEANSGGDPATTRDPDRVEAVSNGIAPIRIADQVIRIAHHGLTARTSGTTSITTTSISGTSGSRRTTSRSTTSKTTASATGITLTTNGTKMDGPGGMAPTNIGSGARTLLNFEEIAARRFGIVAKTIGTICLTTIGGAHAGGVRARL